MYELSEFLANRGWGDMLMSKITSKLLFAKLLTIFASFLIMANSSFANPKLKTVSSDQWLDQELNISVSRILKNISPTDGRPGSVIAAQTRNNPNYYYHWVRDAALTIESLMQRYRNLFRTGSSVTRSERQILKQKMMEYFEFSEFLQGVPTLEGLGEPKFNVDGSAYNDPWGRPQNDSPALRALSLIHLAQILIDEGQLDFVKSRFYNAKMPANTVIKRDLEFVSNHWQESSFDIWEEVKGDHFYTRLLQRRALKEGAELASTLGDVGASLWYSQQAQRIESDLGSFWDESKGYIVATKNRVGGLDYKYSGLDSAVILAFLHASNGEDLVSFLNPKVQATLIKLETSFGRIYEINKKSNIPGTAIGRYPEDMYGGNHFNSGNPWVLTTLAFAESYYRMAAEYLKRGQKDRASECTKKAESFVSRVQYHANSDGSLNEQFDRNTGFMTSVQDLTWSYASVLTTFFARP
jgi:glucoamylase